MTFSKYQRIALYLYAIIIIGVIAAGIIGLLD